MNIPPAFQNAIQLHQAGRLAEAEAIYRQILAIEPRHADAMHLLGVIALQVGRNDLAADWIRQAITLTPDFPDFHANLGEAYRRMGRADEAIAACRQALELKPDHAGAHCNLGAALALQGRFEEAVTACRAALRLQPDLAEAHNNIGNAMKAQGRLDEAITAYCRALELKPRHAEACNNLGNALLDQGRFDEAIGAFRRAIELRPDYAEAHSNLGNALKEQGRFDEAISACSRALELRPDYAMAHNNLGVALMLQGRLDEAAAACSRALELQPDCANTRFNQSILLLLRGDFERAWPLYEARWELKHRALPRRKFPQPLWDGGPLDGRRVLIHAEQGLGDSIQFIRYASLVAKRGGVVVVECQRSLVELFRGGNGVAEVVAAGDPLPAFDFHVPMLSLPLVFRTTPATIPREVPYLFADPTRSEAWRERLGGDRSRLRVGLAWAGNRQSIPLRKRHVPLDRLLPLLDVDGVDVFSLQKDCGAGDLEALPAAAGIRNHCGSIENFADTAALLAQLDLVISVDTAVLHLAGSLGQPAWALLAAAPDWRWMIDRSDSPWYPTMRLFRQSRMMDWEPVIREVRAQLQRLVESRK